MINKSECLSKLQNKASRKFKKLWYKKTIKRKYSCVEENLEKKVKVTVK